MYPSGCQTRREHKMWTETTQQQYRRDSLRYASDVTDEEWALVEGFLPRPRKLGRPRTTEMREVVNALLYMLTTGCQWRLLPKEFPPFSTVQRFFYRWREAGLWQTINHSLVMQAREASGREASPTSGIAMAHRWSWPRSDISIRGCGMSLPTAPTAAPSSTPLSTKSVSGPSRSSNVPIPSAALSSCRGAGLSSALSLGSIAIDASPKTLKPACKVP